jgi:hypothetical protein
MTSSSSSKGQHAPTTKPAANAANAAMIENAVMLAPDTGALQVRVNRSGTIANESGPQHAENMGFYDWK